MIRMLEILKEKNKYTEYLNSVLKKYGIDISYLKNFYNNIDTYQMYNVPFHGLHHSEKVCLYALILAKKYKLDSVETQIIRDAALYHDIGRVNDYEDTTHGLMSANKIEKVIDKHNKVYQDKDNIIYLKAIIEAHSLPDKDKKFVFENYQSDYPTLKYEKYDRLYNILLDADALDRTRFRKTSKAALKEDFLRLPESKELVEFATILNEYYRYVNDKLNFSKLNQQYNPNDPNKRKEGCFHGISSNFYALESILKNGILSEYAMRELGINSYRNFFGNNNSMFISVIDDKSYSKNGKAKNVFLKENISLYCLVTNMSSGKSSNNQSRFADTLPTDSDEYSDERFVFNKILSEQIFSVVIPKSIINKDIKTLDYMSGSLCYDIVLEKVNFYLNKLEQYCINNYDKSKLSQLLNQYKNEVVIFEKLSQYEQKTTFNKYCQRLEQILKLINVEMQKIVNLLWHVELGKKRDTIITINDVVNHILYKNNMNFSLQDGGEELLYILNHEKIKKK